MDSKKYYYIKLKDNYFDQDNIKILESMKNGHTYSLIIIKLYLRASKYDGRLMMTPTLPYDPDNIDILANVIHHDIDHVKQAIRAGVELDLITVIDGREIWMTEIQNMIGNSSTEADRVREYRHRIKQVDTGKEIVQMYDKRTPEREIKIKKETEREEESKEKPPSRKKVSHEKTGRPMNATRYKTLCDDYGQSLVDRYIQKVADYADSKGKVYKDYAATAAQWLDKDKMPTLTNQFSDVKIAKPLTMED